MRVRAAAFVAGLGADHRGHRVAHQVLQLQRLHQVAVPDQAAVGHRHVGQAAPDLAASSPRPRSGVVLLRNTAAWLCMVRCMSSRSSATSRAALGVARAIEAIQRRLAGLRRQRRLAGAGLDRSPPRDARRRGRTPRGRAASWCPAGWRRAPTRRPPRRPPSGRARPRPGWPRVGRSTSPWIVRRHAAHVVVHRRQHRDRLLGHVDAGEHLRGLGNARQPLVQQRRRRDAPDAA